MKKKLFGFFRTNREGLALISVLGVVTLATILILALFSVSDAEFKSARNYADGATARQFADNAINLVISQIQAAATGAGVPGGGNGGTIWASQPGGVRVYKNNGDFVMGRRLYSSSTMIVSGSGAGAERSFARDVPAQGWNIASSSWVDLNEPVIHSPGGAGAPAAAEVIFPILDPRAARPLGGIDPIEGFSFRDQVPWGNGTIDGVINTGSDESLRVPMPVEWLYILKDGTMGTMAGGGQGEGSWAGVTGGGTPTKENPIVGRVGFWTDDETCRVNINTAGEPGFFATPTVFHGRDWNWANSQPVLFEYQRYPGHPATVALSSVLHPNPDHITSKYDADSYPSFPVTFLELKDKLCDLAPKLAPGGSGDGSRSYAPDDFSSNVTPEIDALKREIKLAYAEHPFVSVDELIFKNKQSSTTGREQASLRSPVSGELISPEALERARFFLTAQSRAPETNMYGYPRVAIWPVPDDSLGAKFRTAYDSMIAYAGSLGNPTNAYYFRRRDANSALVDIGADSQFSGSGLQRNSQLMTYLDNMISSRGVKMPGGGNFDDKYGNDARQILVEIFDYIRITNLYDSFLDEQYVKERGKRDFWDDNSPVEAGAKQISIPGQQSRLWTERPAELSYYTYTAPRFDTMRRVGDLGGIVPAAYTKDFKNERVTTGMYPGHGQVRPIEWDYKGQKYRGLGRFPTISEIALHFICTADGRTDNGSFEINTPEGVKKSGGKSAKMIDPNIENDRRPLQRTKIGGGIEDRFWYSNIPPFPDKELFERWGCTFDDNTNSPRSWTKHPAYNPMNWNMTLDTLPAEAAVGGKKGVQLEEDEKRVQIAMQIELFVPAVGYTKYAPDFTIVLDGEALSNLQVQDAKGTWSSVFSSTLPQVIQSTIYYTGSALGEHQGATNISPVGGSYAAQPLMANRVAKGIGEMPPDNGYNDDSTADKNAALLNFPLVSNFFTIKRDQPILFRNSGDKSLRINIFAAHDYKDGKNSTPAQSVFVKFPSGSTPPPKMVVYSTEKRRYIDTSGNQYIRNATHAPRWWSFNAGGALNRLEGKGDLSSDRQKILWGGNRVQRHTWDGNKDLDSRGRFTGLSNTSTNSRDVNNKWFKGADAAIPMSSVIYGYSPIAQYAGVQSRPSDFPNEDTFQDQLGTMGAYGCYGTDAVRSLMPRHGDYRILAGRSVVPDSVWERHRVWEDRPNDLFAHSLGGTGGPENGFDTGVLKGNTNVDALTQQWADYRMVAGTWYPTNQVPDTRMTPEAAEVSSRSGDFDNGPGNIRDGPYINKPDDGNLSVGQMWYGTSSKFAITRNAYFIETFLQFPSTASYFTPNRMISSPVMFGSLPTGVYGSRGRNEEERANGVPWRTLLFRPDFNGHVGGPALSPADHYFLDLYWMPVVQPYAISDSFSTAGKINLNYQMLGFPHINRSTALHAAMKGELISAFSQKDADPRKSGGVPSVGNTVVYKTSKNGGNLAANSAVEMWGSGDPMDWHRRINIAATLKQLDDRFYFTGGNPGQGAFQGLMRTASQLCELHLVPVASSVGTRNAAEGDLGALNDKSNTAGIALKMRTFWSYNNITGDNTRERPYANLYQKFTTRSNTYRVYFISQTIKKAKSVDAANYDEAKDSVTAEYRGSALLERYLDFTSSEAGRTAFPNYAATTDPFSQPSLERSYRYRVLEMKQFSP